jgi:hypothetical protein
MLWICRSCHFLPRTLRQHGKFGWNIPLVVLFLSYSSIHSQSFNLLLHKNRSFEVTDTPSYRLYHTVLVALYTIGGEEYHSLLLPLMLQNLTIGFNHSNNIKLRVKLWTYSYEHFFIFVSFPFLCFQIFPPNSISFCSQTQSVYGHIHCFKRESRFSAN